MGNIAAIEALLTETEEAHGVFETAELKGVYDEEWPAWYAAYIVENGIGDLTGTPVSADRLAEYLARTFAEFNELDQKPAESWAAYAARRIAEDP